VKEDILKLRKLGFSYNQICKELGCSKGTVSYHCGKRTGKKRDGSRSKCLCGDKKSYGAKVCHECKIKNLLLRQELRTLEDICSRGNARVKWAHLRGLAKRKMEIYNVPKKCKICSFDLIVHCCHIKPISSFSMESLVGEVNSLSNLVYLCPNHHAMFDKDLIKL